MCGIKLLSVVTFTVQTDLGTVCEGTLQSRASLGTGPLGAISEAGCHGVDKGYSSHSSPVSFYTIHPVVEAEALVVGW